MEAVRRGFVAGLLFAILVAAPADAVAPAEAASLGILCRRQCKDAIAACVSSTGRRRPACRTTVLNRCKVEGLAACAPPESDDITALHSGPACIVQADTFVQQSDPNKNYGTRSLLEVDNSPMQRTFIRILVSGVGGAQVVTSARLRLKVAEGGGSNSGGQIHHQPGCGWNETGSNGLTWNNQPAFNAAVLDSEGPVNEKQVVEFDVNATYRW